MNAVEMVKEICKQRDIPISRLERECGFSNGYIGKLKRGYFPIDKAEKIRYKVYRCMFHYRTIPTCSNARTLNEAKLEKYLVENIKNLAFAEINEGKDKERPDYEKQIESLERKIERLKDLYVNELITLDEYKHDVASYKADIERFHKDMSKYANADKSALKSLVGMNLEDWYWTLTVAEKRTLWLGVIDKIWFGDDKQIRVDFLT